MRILNQRLPHLFCRISDSLYLIVLLALPAFFFFACSGEKKEAALTIGNNGNLPEILVPKNADKTTAFAASELQSYFHKMTGKELAIKEPTDGKNPAIRLELSDEQSLVWDGFAIEKDQRGVTLKAREPRGLLYAAYALLEETGCSFFYPGEKEEIIPKKELINIPPGNTVISPVLEHRGLAPYGLQASSVETGRNFIDWMAKNRLNYILVSENRPSDSDGPANGSIWKEVTHELLPELQKRGFVIEMSEHCTPEFFPRTLFKDHPDWFALNHGKRELGAPPYSGQICYSNKAAIEYYGTALAAYAAKHPEFHTIGTWPLDGGQYCECENCKDPQTIFKAAMRVAEKVGEVRPDIIVEHLSYQAQTWKAPDMERIPKNMSVLWCPDAGEKTDTLKEWVGKASGSGGVYQFEYYLGDNYRSCTNVWLRPAYAAGIAANARNLGLKGVISLYLPIQSWWRSSFNSWFYARSCWDTALNVPLSVRKYCKDYYGDKSGEVEEIFNDIFTKLQQEPYEHPETASIKRIANTRTISASLINKINGILAQTKDPEITSRLERIKTYVEFSLLHCEAFANKTKAGLENLIGYSKEHPEQDMTLMYPGYIRWRIEEDYFQKAK